MPSVANVRKVMPIYFMVICFIHINQSSIPMVNVIHPESWVNLIFLWITKNAEPMSGVRRIPLSSVDESILILQGQFFKIFNYIMLTFNLLFRWVNFLSGLLELRRIFRFVFKLRFRNLFVRFFLRRFILRLRFLRRFKGGLRQIELALKNLLGLRIIHELLNIW